MINLWSKRHSIACGLHWKLERTCDPVTAGEWLALFQRDEPDVQFVLSERKPR